ncbi:MAG: family transposase [Edaphobacter sp.]|nr:family transposase [Edaphobacter sp.]
MCFAKRWMAALPPGLTQALGPVLEQIAEMTKKIKQIRPTHQAAYGDRVPKDQALIQVYDVGQLTALTYVLTLGNKERFQRRWSRRMPESALPVRFERRELWKFDALNAFFLLRKV